MTKATKNNGTFEALNMREGVRYSAKRNEVEIVITPCNDYCLATLWLFDRPKVDVEGHTASYALGRLAKATAAISWTDASVVDEVMTLAKDLNDFIKRPARETYNSR